MQKEFYIDNRWNSDEGVEMLKNKVITAPMERSVACLTYPAFQLILEAWLSSKDVDTQEVEYFEDGMDGNIEFSWFTCVKEDGEWQSNCYINSEADVSSKVDFSSENWREELKKTMAEVAERYAETNHYHLDKANF